MIEKPLKKITVEDLNKIRESAIKERTLNNKDSNIKITVHLGTCGIASGAEIIRDAAEQEIKKRCFRKIIFAESGCVGFCALEPMITVESYKNEPVTYHSLDEDKVKKIFDLHVDKGILVSDLEPIYEKSTLYDFYRYQESRVLRNRGQINPFKITDYIARDGYQALAKAIEFNDPYKIISMVTESGLRGRGGAGFSTGKKWDLCKKASSSTGVKFVICNGDEGDPGAFMDRNLLESDPHSVLEGVLIAALAIGSAKGYAYIRAEYPLAIKTFSHAIEQATDYGLIGKDILGSGFDFDVEIYQGAGAFVCGEETALLRSIEGKRGFPASKPPFPASEGLYGMPTLINNVETFSNIPQIILNGADWFNSIGTETSKGTKIFALTGAVNNVGLVEVPMGISLRDIVFKIGGGIKGGKKFKAAQLGGPSGGCIPEKFLDIPIDYERVKGIGAIMGSGGMIILDEDTCMVDLSRYFMDFIQDESCGQCVPCRIGTRRMLEELDVITTGKGEEASIKKLEKLGSSIKESSLCGLGKSAPNPILSTIKYFNDEYVAHVRQKRCPAVVCKEIISSPCQHTCPIDTKACVYISLIAAGRFEEAFKIILKDNPLPSVCGRVCSHPCEEKCEAGKYDNPIAIRSLKRFAVDYAKETGIYPMKKEKNISKESVAIIGSGPAGLAAGYDLAGMGYDITIFEEMDIPGGVPAIYIPEYRLPKSILDMDIENIKNTGVKILTNTKIGRDLSFKNLISGYKAVFIATGAHKSKKLNIPGEDAYGIMDALEILKDVKIHGRNYLGKTVGIIGGGNVAVDAARTISKLKEIEKVILIYRRTEAEMPAFKEEIEALKEEGIETQFLSAPKRIITSNGKLKGIECIRMELSGVDASGRRKPVPVAGSEFTIELDNLLVAIGEEPETSFLNGTSINFTKWGTIEVETETLATNIKGVFAGGDVVLGPSTIVESIAHGKIAAGMIDKYIRGKELTREYSVTKPPMYLPPIVEEPEIIEKTAPGKLKEQMPALNDLYKDFKKENLILLEKVAVKEARRCLRCDLETEEGKKAVKR